MSINKVILTGRIGADIALKKTQAGISCCNFQIAVDRVRSKSQDHSEIDWISCQAWRQSAEYLCNYAKKGTLIAIDGRIQTRSYDNASGQKVYVTEVVCERVEILKQPSTQLNGQKTQLASKSLYAEEGEFASDYMPTITGYKDPYSDDYGSNPVLDINSYDLPF